MYYVKETYLQSNKLSKQAIEEFKLIYFQAFGEHITDETANLLGLEFLNFIQIIYKSLINSSTRGGINNAKA